jgi:hypothetical protein
VNGDKVLRRKPDLGPQTDIRTDMVTDEKSIMNQTEPCSAHRSPISINAGDDFFKYDIRSENHV